MLRHNILHTYEIKVGCRLRYRWYVYFREKYCLRNLF